MTMNQHNVILIDQSEPSDIVICLQEIGIVNFKIAPTLDIDSDFSKIDLIIVDAQLTEECLDLFDNTARPALVTIAPKGISYDQFSFLAEEFDEVFIRPFDPYFVKLRLSNLLKTKPLARTAWSQNKQDAHYKKLLDLSRDIILTVTNGVVTYANKTALNTLDISQGTLIGKRLSHIAHNDCAQFIEESLPELAETQDRQQVQFKGKKNDKIHALLTVTPIPDECPNTYLLQAIDHLEQKSALETLLQRERQYKSLVEMSSNLIFIVSDGVIIYANPSSEEKLNNDRQKGTLIGRPLASIVDIDYVSIIDGSLGELAEMNERLPLKIHSLDGTLLDVVLRVAHMNSELNETYLIEAVDVSKQKRSAEALLEREERLSGIVDNAPDAIISMDEQGNIESFNNSAVKIFGLASDDAIQKNLLDLVRFDKDLDNFTKNEEILLKDCSAKEAVGLHISGKEINIDLSIKSMHFGEQKSYIAIIRDVTLQKRDHEELAFLANHDPLTKLPNSHFLLKTLERITEDKSQTCVCCVLFITLERLNRVNDLFGHQMVDQVLSAVAIRLNETIGHNNIIGRWGGGKFVAIIDDLSRGHSTKEICESVITTLSQSFFIEDNEIVIGCKIGVSCYPIDCDNPSSLVKNAGMAAFAARQEENTHYLFYTKAMEAEAEERDMLERELRLALEHDQLQVYYQPKIDLSTGHIRGMEALIRWIHPDLGFISPAKFIPIAEETGQIITIGEWVLRRSCYDTQNWITQGASRHLKVAVNLSGRQLDEEKLPQTIQDILEETGLHPTNLELEVTESSLMRDIDQGMRILKSLRDLGITTAIDDFGTGYSSLSYLRRIPLDTLKIDQSFVRNLHVDPDDAAIARTIMDMADNMGLTVVAEGIEIEEHETFLQSIHCHIGQGYYYSKPVPAIEFDKLLTTFSPPKSLNNRRAGKDRRAQEDRRKP